MKRGSLIFMVVLLLILAGCGEDTAVTPEPTPVREPTLTVEERMTYSWGMAENPLQMVIRPVGVVEPRVYALIANTLDLSETAIIADSSLREDLGLGEQLAELNDAFSQDFNLTIDKWDAEAILTVADLVGYVRMQLGKQVSASLFQRTGLYIDIIPVATTGDALQLLCDSGSGIVSISWLDGLAYAVGAGRNCGEPAMQIVVSDMLGPAFADLVVAEATPEATVEMTAEATAEATAEVTPDSALESVEEEPLPEPTAIPEATTISLSTGEAGLIIASQSLGAVDMQVVVARTFCRLGYDDFYSWLVPTLVMGQNNINPETDLLEIVDYPDEQSLVQALADGDCAATGMSQSAYDALDEIPDITVIATTAEFPHAVLMYPVEIGLGVRLKLAEELPALADDPLENRPLRLLLGQTRIAPVETDDLAAFDEFLATTGFDFAQLGD